LRKFAHFADRCKAIPLFHVPGMSLLLFLSRNFHKSMLMISSIGFDRQILFYTTLDFFKIAAGYLCKIRLA